MAIDRYRLPTTVFPSNSCSDEQVHVQACSIRRTRKNFANSWNMKATTTLLFAFLLLSAPLSAVEVRFKVNETTGIARNGWPITSGVPFAKGQLPASQAVALRDETGTAVPVQSEVLSRWADGSVRWLLLDFQTSLRAKQAKRFVIRTGQAAAAESNSPLKVVRKKSGIEIVTGPLRVQLQERSFRLLDRVWLDGNGDGRFAPGERVSDSRGAGIELTTPAGKRFRADLRTAKMSIEQSGPWRACVRIEGRHASAKGSMFAYVIRVQAFRGKPYLKLSYTFVNNNTAVLMTKVDSLALIFSVTGNRHTYVTNGRVGSAARLFQADDRSYEIDGKQSGRRALGWAAISGQAGGVAVGMPEFWQNWPKSLETRQSQLRVGICPQFKKGRYDGKPIKEECKLYYYLRNGEYAFKLGVAKTHEVWAHYFTGRPKTGDLGAFFRATQEPLLAQCSAAHYGQSRATGGTFPPASSGRYERYDTWLDGFFKLHLDDQDVVREYGLLNWGDWYNIKWDSWGNNEYDTAHGFFVQYMRTGNRRYFDRAAQSARHQIDVDTLHAVNEDMRRYGGSFKAKPGYIWAHIVGHTGGYYARYNEKKGVYENEAPLIMKGAYQQGLIDWGHMWIAGALQYYMFTGDRRAMEVCKMSADALAERMPTRYTDHLRGIGWPLRFMVAAYDLTGDKKYLQGAKKLWAVLKKHYDPKKGWVVLLAYGHCNEASVAKRCRGQNSYMLALTLSALAGYHRVTQDPEVLKALSVGLDQLIRESWSEKDKSFYLTSCVHLKHIPAPKLSSPTFLSAYAFAYEFAHTKNKEHRRIFRAAFRTSMREALKQLVQRKQQGQTGYSSMNFHHTAYGLSLLEGP